jgi:hypothetical protein
MSNLFPLKLTNKKSTLNTNNMLKIKQKRKRWYGNEREEGGGAT